VTRGADTARALADASAVPFWLDRSDVPPPPLRPPLERRVDVDLLVVGAGFTGLWAAYEAARDGWSVLVVDGGSIASGASGRNGGFINSSITHGIAHGHARWPGEMATIVRLQRAIWHDTLDVVAGLGGPPVIETAGKLTVATQRHHADGLAGSVELLRSYGEDAELLSRAQLAEVVQSPTYFGGYLLRSGNGLCDPARLAWALAALAERAGATIAEHTMVTSLAPTDPRDPGVTARLRSGLDVRAGRALLATNAFPPLLRRIKRYVIPVYDHAIVTEPLDDVAWKSIGWSRPVGITDAGNRFHYYRPTPDGRILFGGWEATYRFGGRVDARYEQAADIHALLVRHLVDTFPALADVRVSHAWGGPIDSTSRFTPTMHTAWNGRLGWAVGFTGLGVGASRFAALAALDLLDGRATERTSLSMVRRQPIPFPPEPLRWSLVAATKRALAREDETGRRGWWLRLLDRFGVGFDT
jgi:glycine/D-amino acid oxidase-like deaminating enzyme